MNNNFKQTEIGLIPDDWEIYKIKDVFSFTKKPRMLNIDKDVNVPFIPMEMIPDNKVYVEDYELKKFGSFSSGTYFEVGDILLAKITPSFENGKQAIPKIPYAYGYATTEVIPIKEIEHVSSKYFLFNYLLKNDIRNILAGKMEGSTGRQRLSKTVLQNTLIPLPPLPEQKKIAHILSKIQQAIEIQEGIIKTTQELKKALMQKLFTEGLNGEPQKQTEIGPIPQSWEVERIGKYNEVGTGGTPSTKIKSYYFSPTINWIKSGDIKNLYIDKFPNKISTDGYNNSNAKLHPIGSVMLAMSGRGKTRGTTAILKQEACCSQSVAAIIPNIDHFTSEFIHYSLQFRYENIRNLTGSNDRSGLNLSLVRGIKIHKPNLRIQKEVTNILLSLENKYQISLLRISMLKDLFQASLNQLMTGQIRVNEIEFETEKILEEIES